MADNETIADIIAEIRKPREGENAYLTLWRDEIADRIEAAHKREMSKICPKTGGDFGQLGDAAKLREALNRLVIASEGFLKTHSAKYYVDTTEALDKAKAALAAPPRNCDVGSAKDQYARFVDMCHANVDLAGRCRESCPFRRVPAEYKCDRAECYAEWAQMPYEEGGAK